MVWAATFSPDGLRLASGGRDHAVWVWDALTGEPLGEPLTGHDGVVCDVAFSPDGQLLASSSYDHTVQIWDGHTSERLVGHTDAVHGVAFSPDGRRLVSASQDQTLRLWNPLGGQAPEDPRDLCATLTANMSKEQWRVWVSPDIDYVPACPDLPIPGSD
jgi:WD40 repeat protein